MESGEDFGNILRKNAQPREYLMVSSLSATEENEEDEVLDYEFKSMDNDSVAKFSEVFKQWLDYSKSIRQYIQPYVIAKICTRMYYAYSNVKLKSSNKLKTIADIMQECMLLMFNSVIVEEFAENNPLNALSENDKAVIDRENKIKVFYENMKVVNDVFIEDIPLCKIFLTCPLFLFFVDFSNNDNNVLTNFCEKVTNDFDAEFYKKNAYKVLKESEIKVKNVSSKKRSITPKGKTAKPKDAGSQQ